jgi:hypothetical protein
LVQLATGTKRRIHDMVRSYSISLNVVNTSIDINVIPLGSYDILIGMDWLDKHLANFDFVTRHLHVLMEMENKAL